MRSYESARRFFGFLEIVAWLLLIGGVLGVVGGYSIASDAARYGRIPPGMLAISIVPGLLIAVVGIMGIVVSQSSRASVDTAELTGQILKVARDQLEVSKQGLRSQHHAPSDFNALADRPSDKGTADFASMGTQMGTAQAIPENSAPPALQAGNGNKALPEGATFESQFAARTEKKSNA